MLGQEAQSGPASDPFQLAPVAAVLFDLNTSLPVAIPFCACSYRLIAGSSVPIDVEILDLGAALARNAHRLVNHIHHRPDFYILSVAVTVHETVIEKAITCRIS